MSSPLEVLRARIKVPAKPGRRTVWDQPEPSDFAFGTVLAFDQTLTKTGWAVVRSGDGLAVLDGGLILPPKVEERNPFRREMRKGLWLKHYAFDLCDTWGSEVDAIVMEMPAVLGYRLESSRIAAHIVWSSADETGYQDKTVIVSKQRAYSRLVHVQPSHKRHVTAAVERLIPRNRRSTDRWNQDVHDAVLLGLQWLHERKTP